MNTLLRYLFSDFKWYRKTQKGIWYYMHWKLDPGMRYWTQRQPLKNERVIRKEDYTDHMKSITVDRHHLTELETQQLLSTVKKRTSVGTVEELQQELLDYAVLVERLQTDPHEDIIQFVPPNENKWSYAVMKEKRGEMTNVQTSK